MLVYIYWQGERSLSPIFNPHIYTNHKIYALKLVRKIVFLTLDTDLSTVAERTFAIQTALKRQSPFIFLLFDLRKFPLPISYNVSLYKETHMLKTQHEPRLGPRKQRMTPFIFTGW